MRSTNLASPDPITTPYLKPSHLGTPPCPPLQEAIARIKKWVESRIPDKHIKDRTCVVDVSEVRAPVPAFTPLPLTPSSTDGTTEVHLCPAWMTRLDHRAEDRSIETPRLTGNRPTRTTHIPADRMRRPRVRPHRHRGANHLRGEGGRSGWHGVCFSVPSRGADERGSRRAHAPGVDLRGLVRG